MGNIKKVLAISELEPRSITSTSIWGDLCENIHLHYRNTRLEFSEREWASFRAAINGIGHGIEKVSIEQDYREGDPQFLISISFNEPILHDSKYFSDRFVIELERDDTVHIHYRDIRFHVTLAEFKQIANSFVSSLQVLDSVKPFKYENSEKRLRATVDINDIQPYDAGHRPGNIDADHRAGIEYAKSLILSGKKLRPILVDATGQRLDGFKRYMAYYELGYKEIDCIIDPFPVALGGQSNQSMVED